MIAVLFLLVLAAGFWPIASERGTGHLASEDRRRAADRTRLAYAGIVVAVTAAGLLR